MEWGHKPKAGCRVRLPSDNVSAIASQEGTQEDMQDGLPSHLKTQILATMSQDVIGNQSSQIIQYLMHICHDWRSD